MASAPRILIVDDDQLLADSIGRHLSRRGHRTTSVYLLSEAVAALDGSLRAEMPFQAIITDLQLPDGDGRDLIRAAREKLPQCPIVLMTGSGSVSGAVEAIRLGALTVLEKPASLETIEAELREALDRRGGLGAGIDAAIEAGIIGRSQAIRAVIGSVLLAAPTEATILIEGETGTGKELLARAVHRLSRRAQKPFVAVNCAALTETLAESELFGHVKGAFTGADRPRAGCFRQAHEGTLFLDEIGEMSLPLQAKLLRVLQEGEVQPVGSDRSEQVDVRVVAATNRILADQVVAGRFREDLYYRLNVLTLRLPPLRERTADIAPLVCRFAGDTRRFTPAALAALERHPWPGNVRELQNLVQRLVVLKPVGDIDVADLPPSFHGHSALPAGEPRLPDRPIDLNAVLREMEDRLIREALDRCGGNKSEAARSLGLNRTTLVEKLRRMQSPRRPPQ